MLSPLTVKARESTVGLGAAAQIEYTVPSLTFVVMLATIPFAQAQYADAVATTVVSGPNILGGWTVVLSPSQLDSNTDVLLISLRGHTTLGYWRRADFQSRRNGSRC